jgi:hypothetical protein
MPPDDYKGQSKRLRYETPGTRVNDSHGNQFKCPSCSTIGRWGRDGKTLSGKQNFKCPICKVKRSEDTFLQEFLKQGLIGAAQVLDEAEPIRPAPTKPTHQKYMLYSDVVKERGESLNLNNAKDIPEDSTATRKGKVRAESPEPIKVKTVSVPAGKEKEELRLPTSLELRDHLDSILTNLLSIDKDPESFQIRYLAYKVSEMERELQNLRISPRCCRHCPQTVIQQKVTQPNDEIIPWDLKPKPKANEEWTKVGKKNRRSYKVTPEKPSALTPNSRQPRDPIPAKPKVNKQLPVPKTTEPKRGGAPEANLAKQKKTKRRSRKGASNLVPIDGPSKKEEPKIQPPAKGKGNATVRKSPKPENCQVVFFEKVLAKPNKTCKLSIIRSLFHSKGLNLGIIDNIAWLRPGILSVSVASDHAALFTQFCVETLKWVPVIDPSPRPPTSTTKFKPLLSTRKVEAHAFRFFRDLIRASGPNVLVTSYKDWAIDLIAASTGLENIYVVDIFNRALVSSAATARKPENGKQTLPDPTI